MFHVIGLNNNFAFNFKTLTQLNYYNIFRLTKIILIFIFLFLYEYDFFLKKNIMLSDLIKLKFKWVKNLYCENVMTFNK